MEVINQHYTGGVFCEPFFGGGGITFALLKENVISSLCINEVDPALADLWNQVLRSPDKISRRVRGFRPSVDKFNSFKASLLKGEPDGFQFLVVNRTSHGGRGVMAGVQGGENQSGPCKVDCRWNPNQIVKNIELASMLLTSVPLLKNQCLNKSYEQVLELGDFFYLDPPYWEIGRQLYFYSFTEQKHKDLRRQLVAKDFVLSYNNCSEIRQLYQGFNVEVCSTAGNGGGKPKSELIITP